MNLTSHRTFDFLYSCLSPIVWSLAIITLSGDLGSFENTKTLIRWLISWFATITPAQIDLINLYLRKIGHAFAYGILYFFWFRAFHGDMGIDRRQACLYSLGLCLALAVADEGRQAFHPARGSSLGDVLLDAASAGLAALITFAVWVPKNARIQRRSPKTRLL